MPQLLYSSECVRQPLGDELATILIQARRNNRINGITGLLWTNGFRFVQVLEGGWEAVQSCFEVIRADVRHEHVTVLVDTDIGVRSFDAWSMALLDDDNYRIVGALERSSLQLQTAFVEAIGEQVRICQSGGAPSAQHPGELD